MEPTNDSKMQLKLMALVLAMSVGIAFAGQWVFNKCFSKSDVKHEKVQPKMQSDTTKSVDSLYMYKKLNQKQK